MDAQLHISDDENVIGPVCDFTYRWCLETGMEAHDALHFTVAISELISNIIQFAYPYEHQAYFDITFTQSLSNVEIIVSEVGEPFDPDLHRYNAKKAIQNGNFEGAGFRIIRSFTDDFLFINKGREGKEFRLLKNLEMSVIDALMERSKAQQQSVRPKEEKKASIETYVIEKITSSDAEDIAKLIYRTYEYSYTKEDMYFPKKIERTLNSKEKIGVITRTKTGEAIGYFAILKSKDSNIGEVGEAVVSPDYRRQGIMSNMMEYLIETAKDQNLDGLFGKAVTTHPVSQKVNFKYNFVTTALMLAQVSKMKFKGFEKKYPQPISEVIDFLPLKKERERKLYLPTKYKNILRQTYRQLGISNNKLGAHIEYPELAKKSNMQLLINYSDSTSLIIVHIYGPDFKAVLSDMITSLEKQEPLNAIYLDLPLANPATPSQFKRLEGMGFIYCGLAPFFHQQADYIRVQKVYAELEIDLIEVYSDFGKKIKSLIADEYYGLYSNG